VKYRKLGDTDLEVSSICLGSWVFGGDVWGEIDDDESERVVCEALDRGINFIDTAPIYGSGRSECIISNALKQSLNKAIIATKCGLEQKGKTIRVNLSKEFIREDIEYSLKRLGVDTIDLYQCHWPDKDTPLEETFTELNKLVDEGKIRYIGVSNFDDNLLESSIKLAPVVSNQVQYSIFERNIEQKLISVCREHNVKILSYGSLGGGILTGKYSKPPVLPKNDVRSFFYKFYSEDFLKKSKDVISQLESLAGERGVPVAQVAINWILSHEEVASCIVGCRTSSQLRANIGAADWELTQEEVAEIESSLVARR